MVAESGTPKSCPVCGTVSNGHAVFSVREMMMGSREEFAYRQCSNCDALYICEIPRDLSVFYPSDYYSLQPKPSAPSRGGIAKWLRKEAMKGRLGSPGPVSRLAAKFRKIYLPWLTAGKFNLDSNILDVGCGAGGLVRELAQYGFERLTGIDPFMPEHAIRESGNPRLMKREMNDMTGETFDLVMLHHVFEHLPAPNEAMIAIKALLKPGGRALIRVPLADSHAFRKYGVHWVQLDAPRHLVVPTVRAINILAKNAGLVLEDIMYDSTALQFYGSEAYLRDIPLIEANKHFSPEDYARFTSAANHLNLAHDGDMACFWLRNPETN